MSAPVERGMASAAYSFVRFAGGAAAPCLAGKLGEDTICICRSGSARRRHLAGRVLLTGRQILAHIDAEPGHGASPTHGRSEAEAVTVGDA